MTFSYDSTLDDVSEVSVRLFLRSKTYATNRWRGAALCAAMFAAFAFLGFNAKENINLPAVCAAAAVWGAGLFLLTYKGSIRRRIKKYIATELKGPWPRPVVYEIKDGKLLSTTSGTTITFALSDLSSVTEDSRYLELTFDSANGIAVIPLRAFDDTYHKAAFLAQLPSTR